MIIHVHVHAQRKSSPSYSAFDGAHITRAPNAPRIRAGRNDRSAGFKNKKPPKTRAKRRDGPSAPLAGQPASPPRSFYFVFPRPVGNTHRARLLTQLCAVSAKPQNKTRRVARSKSREVCSPLVCNFQNDSRIGSEVTGAEALSTTASCGVEALSQQEVCPYKSAISSTR